MEVNGLFGYIVLVADIYAVLQIVQSLAGNGKKAIWIGVVVVLPVVGLIAWYLA
ncbi:MAG: PLDc N-terminal domain-containing protein [Pseudomonadota bacterium]|nr:PLDc N-terminal domain-containing protein [Pseudomonadota bacterium]